MRQIATSPYEVMQSLIGTKEVPGGEDNPLILAMLRTDQAWPPHDETPWCSGGLNFVCKLLGLPRSRDLRARSWLSVGEPIGIEDAEPGLDVLILKRGGEGQPGPDVLDAPGHVCLYAGRDAGIVLGLGSNQGNTISIARYPVALLLGIRRLR